MRMQARARTVDGDISSKERTVHPVIREALLAEHRRDLADAATFAYLTMGAREQKKAKRAARPPRRWFLLRRVRTVPC